jgi:acetylornithine deacetylase/succinyl-diaminopimelate desuccinylase-like protein
MKHMDAMTLAVVREWAHNGRTPPRDIVLAFVADEEAGGTHGARALIENHEHLFADCSEAIGEIGGFSVSLNDACRLYLIQTAEKGMAWLRLRALGRPGHGSMIHDDNAVTRLATAVSRIGSHDWPVHVTPSTRATVAAIAAASGAPLDADDPQQWLPLLGGLARMIGATLRNTANPTVLTAGYKSNVIPSAAEAVIDCRFLPEFEDELLTTIDTLAGPGIVREFEVREPAVLTDFAGSLVDTMCAALRAEDVGAHPTPMMVSGATDAKSFARLGMRCFGFSPLLLPTDLDFAAMFHGIDERVPVDGLRFGVRVLDRFLSNC